MPTTQISNVTFNYEALGPGSQEIVFIPSYTGDIDQWRSIAEQLSEQGYRVLIFDPQGAGKTTDDDTELTAEICARNIIELYTNLGFKRPALVAVAFGGAAALEIARQKPLGVASLTLVASAVKFSDSCKEKCEKLCAYREDNTPESFQRASDFIYTTCFAEAFKGNMSQEAFTGGFWAVLQGAQTGIGQRRQVEALKGFDASEWLSEVAHIPSMVISPKEDQYTSPDDCKALAAALQAEIVSILNAGHAVTLEQPSELLELIQKHINGCANIAHQKSDCLPKQI